MACTTFCMLKNLLLIMCRRCAVTALFSIALISVCYGASPIYLNTSEGIQRLEHADISKPYYVVAPYVDTQENLGFCGPASIVAVLNSLPGVLRPTDHQYKPYGYFTQNNLFNSAASRVKPYATVARSGLTLTEASRFLDAHGIRNRIYYGEDLSLAQLRDLVKATLLDTHSRLIADFDRRVFAQDGSGHYSPVVAYDSVSDSLLIADVAKFKYPPFWISMAAFLDSITTTDPDSNKSRGLILVSEDLYDASSTGR